MRRLALLALLPLLLGAAQPRPAGERVEQLRRSLVEAGRTERQGQTGAVRAKRRLASLNAQEKALAAKIGANRETLTKLLAVLQELQANPPPALLVSPTKARDAVRAAILIKAITPELEARGHAFAVQAQALAKLRRQAALENESLFEAESAVADSRDDIDRLARQKRLLEQSLTPDLADPALGALAARVDAPGELVQGLAGRPDAASLPAEPPAHFLAPLPGPVAHRFGEEGQGRDGVSWRADAGAPVLSPVSGRVDYAGPLKGWGQVAILRLSTDHRLVLAGMDALVVGTGRTVAAGEPVGRMAAPPQGAPDPELYLELRKGAQPIDPAKYLNAQLP